MLNFLIREQTPADSRGLAYVHATTWHSTYTGQIPQELLDTVTPESRLQFWEQVNSSEKVICLLAEVEDKIVGFTTFANPCFLATEIDTITVDIYTLYVLPEFQDFGLGTALLKACYKRLKESTVNNNYQKLETQLWALTTNIKAISFYQRSGFSLTAVTRDDDFEGIKLKEVLLKRTL